MSDDRPRTAPDPGHSYSPARGPVGIALALLVVGLLAILGLAAFGIGPFSPASTPPAGAASPPATDEPTLPIDTPVPPEPSPPPTLDADPSPTPESSPAPPDNPRDELLGYIPADVRDSCVAHDDEHALALATCAAADGAIVVTYYLHGSARAIEQAYEGFVLLSGIERDSGTCSDSQTWPAEGSYSIEQQDVGRVLCLEFEGVPTINWTDERLNIFSSATGTAGQADAVYEFWRRAGPNP